MRIGVIGDTHNNLPNVTAMVKILNRQRVAKVVLTGDITKATVLDVLAGLDAPVHGVYGNNDLERASLEASAARHGMQLVDGPLELHWHGQRIIVVHDPLDLEVHLRPDHTLALHGHTHLPRSEHVNGTLVFNPGECAGMLVGHNAVGLVDLGALQCRRHRF
jgi:putative phosphoesterase